LVERARLPALRAAMALVSLETITGPGPRFAGAFAPLRQRAPRGRLV